jgi:uncharacterized protein (TIGR03437 family)
MKIGNSFSSIALIGLCVAALSPHLAGQTITPSTTSISLNAPASSNTPVSQAVTFTVAGGNGQVLNLSTTLGWLRVIVAPTCTTAVFNCAISNPPSSVNVTVQADPTGLSQGTYSGLINYGFSGGTNSQIAVTFTVGTGSGGGSSVITASPNPMTFAALPGGIAPTQTVTLTNSGGSIAYTASSNVGWLTTNLGSNQGLSPGTLSVTASAVGLPANTYNGTLTLSPVGGGQGTAIQVTFVVSSSQQLQISPSALSFSYINASGAGNPSGSLALGVTTGAGIAYTVAINYPGLGPTGWLSTNPINGGTTGTSGVPSNMTVTANAASLGIGTYTANLVFSATGLSSVTIPVTLTVSAAPTFVVTPSPISINVQPATVGSRTLNVNTSNGAVVNYNVTSSYVSPVSPAVNWLSLAGASGSTPGAVTVSVNPGALGVGTYTALLTINSLTAGVAAVTVPVSMTVTTSQIVTYAPTSLNFNFVGGGVTPSSQNIQLGLTPTTPAQSATVGAVTDIPGQTWLTATLSSPSGSQITGNTNAVVSVNPSGLANGTYTGRVQINVLGAVANSFIEVPVSFTVSGVTGGGGGGGTGSTTVLLSQGQFTFNATPGGVAPDQTLTLTSSTSTAIPYSLSTPTSWISILQPSGTTPGSTIVRINTATLTAGTYQGQIILSASGASNNGLGIPVTLTISATNQLQTTPSGFSFNYVAQSGAFPQAQTLQVSSTTAATLPVTATVTTGSGGGWLSVTPTTVNTLGNFVISVNSGVLQGLSAGTYSANITLQATGALNSTVNIPVSLTITGTGGGGGGTGSDQLIFGPNPMNFYSNVGGAPPSQILDIHTLSGGTLNYSLSAATTTGGSWLSVSPSSGTTPGQISVQANASGLSAGTYSGGITVTSAGAINSGATIPVTLTVSTNTNIVATPAGATFTYVIGSTATLQRVITLSTTNGSVVPITVTTDSVSNRLTVSTNSNSTPAAITVNLNPVGLTAGVYSGTVFVNATGASNSTLSLPVTLIVTGSGGGGGSTQLGANPSSLSFFGQPNGTPPQQRTVQISSTGTAITYSVTTNQTWLSAGPSSGTTPGTITVGVSPANLAAGTYSGQVTVTGGGSTVNIPVTFEVTNNPLLQLNQQQVTFNYQTGQTLPPPRPILVTTSNGSTLNSTVTVTTNSGGNWLVAAPTNLNTPGAFALSLVNSIVQTLGAGTYSATVTVAAPGASNSSATINVTLHVSATALLTMSTTPITFNAQFSGGQPPSQVRQITSTSTPLSVTVSTSTSTGSGWLTANINSNTTPATLTIGASPFNLGTGIYTGTVTVTSGTPGSELIIPVTLNVSSLPLISVDKSELIFGSGGATGTQPQNLQITSSSSNFNFTANASVTNSPTNWLSVSNVTGVTPSSLVVSVNPALLNDGTYFGTIVISATGVGNSPLVIPVTLTVNNATALAVNPTTLSFTQLQGGTLPAQQPVQVTSQSPVSFSYTSTVNSPVGGNWLNITQSGGLTNGFLQVGLNNNAQLLTAGVYTATITVFGPNSPNNVPITVTLTVVPSASVVVAPATLSFAGRVGQPNPTAQTVSVTSSNPAQPVSYNVNSDAAWLTVASASGTTPGQLSVSANVTGLTAGTYTGRLSITPSGVISAQPTVITVTFVVEAVTPPSINTVTNAATFAPAALAPGMIVSIFGNNLGPAPTAPSIGTFGQIVNNRFTTTLAGVRVLFDGIAAPILFANNTQINTIVPYAMAGRASARLTVEYNGVTSTAIEPRLVDTNPGIFTAADGRQAAMFNENGTYNSAANPAPAGSIVAIYVTGSGQTVPAGVDGEVIAANNLKKPIGAVRIRIGGVEVPAADIFYAGSAPTLVSGLEQMNFRIPATAPVGVAVSVEVFVGSGQSQPGVTMSIR